MGYYRAVTPTNIFAEESKAGTDFWADICNNWKKAAMNFENLGIRSVIKRKSVVLEKIGGMYRKLAPLAKAGINVSLGSGTQFYRRWIFGI